MKPFEFHTNFKMCNVTTGKQIKKLLDNNWIKSLLAVLLKLLTCRTFVSSRNLIGAQTEVDDSSKQAT